MMVTILFSLVAALSLLVAAACTLAAYQISRRLDNVIQGGGDLMSTYPECRCCGKRVPQDGDLCAACRRKGCR